MMFVTHHKCMSTFLLIYIGEMMKLNNLSCFHSHRGDAKPDPGHDIYYFTNANYENLKSYLSNRTMHVIRNPLSIVQSAYYSHLRTHPTVNWPELVEQRLILNNVNKNDGLLFTIAFCERSAFLDGTPGPLAALRHWDFDDPRVITVRAEDLVHEPTEVISRAVGLDAHNMVWPDSRNFEFARFSDGRAVGNVDETSHYRSGDSDGWRRELSEAAIFYIKNQFGGLLKRFYPESL